MACGMMHNAATKAEKSLFILKYYLFCGYVVKRIIREVIRLDRIVFAAAVSEPICSTCLSCSGMDFFRQWHVAHCFMN
jgi:hypothetical protein